ncbi:MAG: GNAT family N-acetyltransferase, partial [Candidatus Rokuibacteriota bacterium]
MTPTLPPFAAAPVTLVGRHVRLEPLAARHAADLLEAGKDPSIWTYLSGSPFLDLADTERWIAEVLAEVTAGRQVAFVNVDLASGRAVGSTRYLDIRPADRGIEIGSTWLGTSAQRTAVNTESKYLLLEHAFETLGAFRVQLKTDVRNLRSQNAIARIGATREGVLRRHMVVKNGHVRDSVYFSILDSEW